MTDYIHFDNKLYLLIKRNIWKKEIFDFTQEISIIRLCLDKGRELISSAVEVRYAHPEFQNSQIIEAIFKLRMVHNHDVFRTSNFGRRRPHFSDMFDMVEEMFASADKSVDLLQYHLRSESIECEKCTHEPLPVGQNFITSFDATEKVHVSAYYIICEQTHGNQNYFVQHQAITFAHPFERRLFLHIQNSLSEYILSSPCYEAFDWHYCQSIEAMEQKWKRLNIDVRHQVFVNQRPFGVFFITKKSHEIMFFNFDFICEGLNNCLDCVMYGFYFNCVWSHETPTPPKCIYDDQPKHKTALTNNHCFKIIHFSPSVLYSSLQQTLSIKLNTPFQMDNSEESLVIHTGPDNYCTNIIMNGLNIQCLMNPLKGGKFNIEINLMNDKIADVSVISAVSTEMVQINVLESECDNSSTIIITLFSCLFLILCLFIAYKTCDKEKLTRIRESCGLKRGNNIYSIVQTFRRA
ncbi:uncharacterized protein LOC112538956 [Tetranychus urticae]|uniref:uncharacterized protein LOC112538956 n=1 Tax=Tetranychus urticae TaxID=32264 RepID=UPI000D65E8AE|nr:uncharacterized protein LOC112538956 [Tetranychus urticae]